MGRIYCECGRRAIMFRRVKARGKHRGRIKVGADNRHTLCYRCNNEQFQHERQREKFDCQKSSTQKSFEISPCEALNK